MKKIDKLVLHSFVQHLLLAFLVIVFLLLCRQMLVLFDDIIGKGVGIQALAQLFFQFAIFMVPISIPLAVLLSSLMTMGSFSEHFELTALKSIGVSPNRVILPMFSLVCFLSLVAFYANNYLVPKAALNAYSLLYDIKQKKPALDLQAGVFYSDIPGFNIKIGKKYDDGVTLKDIMIYDHREAKFNGKVTLADSGVMSTLKNERYLKLELFNGHFYRDNGLNYENREQEKGGLSRSYFSKSTYLLDVSALAKTGLQVSVKCGILPNYPMTLILYNKSSRPMPLKLRKRLIIAPRVIHPAKTLGNRMIESCNSCKKGL